MHRNKQNCTLLPKLLLICGLFLFSACGPNQRILQSANENASRSSGPAPAATAAPQSGDIQRDIQAMRDADFNFIHVLRRKDGAPMDADDKRYFNSLTPSEINRRRLADGDRAIIVGSNYRYPAETIAAFKERFIFEDHSKPESEIMGANANINTNSTP